MFRSAFPRPASTPLHVTGMLVVPEKLHTGSPPFLKCGLEATETAENTAKAATAAVAMTMRVRDRIS
jgi:hypothetical protein